LRRYSSSHALVKRGLRTWWRHHPANFAVSVAQPLYCRTVYDETFLTVSYLGGSRCGNCVDKAMEAGFQLLAASNRPSFLNLHVDAVIRAWVATRQSGKRNKRQRKQVCSSFTGKNNEQPGNHENMSLDEEG
jgi:hypothetical protein